MPLLPEDGGVAATPHPMPQSPLAPGAIPPGVNSAYMDPSYLSFLRQLGLDETMATAEVSRRIAGLTQQGQDMQPVYADRLQRGLRDIGEGFQGNGQYKSGRRLVAQSEFQVDQARSQTGAENDIANSIDDTSLSLAKQIAQNRARKSEEELAAQQRTALSGAEIGIRP